jgi:hypothetical protein
MIYAALANVGLSTCLVSRSTSVRFRYAARDLTRASTRCDPRRLPPPCPENLPLAGVWIEGLYPSRLVAKAAALHAAYRRFESCLGYAWKKSRNNQSVLDPNDASR